MASRSKQPPPPTLTVHQVVAYNFRRARELRGWTQEQTSDILERYLGYKLRQAGISAIEKTYDSPRRRNIDVAEVVVFAQAFILPITWFFLPPNERGNEPITPAGEELSHNSAADLVGLLLGTPAGHDRVMERLEELDRTDGDALWRALRISFEGMPPKDLHHQLDLRRQAVRDVTLAQFAGHRDEVITGMAALLVELVKLTPTGWMELRDTDPEAALERIAEGDKLVQPFIANVLADRRAGRASRGGMDDLVPMDAEALSKLVASYTPEPEPELEDEP